MGAFLRDGRFGIGVGTDMRFARVSLVSVGFTDCDVSLVPSGTAADLNTW